MISRLESGMTGPSDVCDSPRHLERDGDSERDAEVHAAFLSGGRPLRLPEGDRFAPITLPAELEREFGELTDIYALVHIDKLVSQSNTRQKRALVVSAMFDPPCVFVCASGGVVHRLFNITDITDAVLGLDPDTWETRTLLHMRSGAAEPDLLWVPRRHRLDVPDPEGTYVLRVINYLLSRENRLPLGVTDCRGVPGAHDLVSHPGLIKPAAYREPREKLPGLRLAARAVSSVRRKQQQQQQQRPSRSPLSGPSPPAEGMTATRLLTAATSSQMLAAAGSTAELPVRRAVDPKAIRRWQDDYVHLPETVAAQKESAQQPEREWHSIAYRGVPGAVPKPRYPVPGTRHVLGHPRKRAPAPQEQRVDVGVQPDPPMISEDSRQDAVLAAEELEPRYDAARAEQLLRSALAEARYAGVYSPQRSERHSDTGGLWR
eukprot:TRINITY_DN19753_c0_g1_i2.p1 TRINITY_DN19753_c0_g1~~TRINITY_DN19753_c0_g1_i2.p1  ORF type:complete len:432 (+),score=105.77 TRINITY_DN19753_c0_g1_i2:92-1387(+)